MTLCILPQTSDNGGTAYRVEGWLTAETASELRQVCRSAPAPVLLNLAHLINADAAGIEVLRHLREEGVRFESPSPYLALLLGLGDQTS